MKLFSRFLALKLSDDLRSSTNNVIPKFLLRVNFELNINPGSWLKELNNKSVEKIYEVDFVENRHEDVHLPWLFFFIFFDFDKFLEIEGNSDGSHIKINLYPILEIHQKLKDNNFSDEPSLWKVYEVESNEILTQFLNQKIQSIEFGVDKDEFEISHSKIRGQEDVFTYIRFYCENFCLTIFESSSGLFVTDNPIIQLDFEETFDKYETK